MASAPFFTFWYLVGDAEGGDTVKFSNGLKHWRVSKRGLTLWEAVDSCGFWAYGEGENLTFLRESSLLLQEYLFFSPLPQKT